MRSMRGACNDRAQWLAAAVLPHEGALRRWLEHKRMRGIDIDDVIQDTYTILVRRASITDIRNPKAYVYQIAFSLALIGLRRARALSIQAVEDIERCAGADVGPSPEQIVADREELRRMAKAIASLPLACREVFVLRKIDGLSQREVAGRLGITEGTVEKQVHKGLNRLKNLLGRGGKSTPRTSTVGGLGEPRTEGVHA